MFNTNVIIVDDEHLLVQLYSQLLMTDIELLREQPLTPGTDEYHLAQTGYKIHTANCGADGVKLAKEIYARGERIAFGFFDMLMPGGMDGLDTIREIRAIDPQILCSIVTGYNSWSVDDINKVFGPDHIDDWDFMSKPFTKDEVIQKARNWVSMWNRRRREEAQAGSLQNSLLQSEQVKQELERQVRERTSALEATNHQLEEKNKQLQAVLAELQMTQSQLLQNEKMASLGQLAAGVAHEINNPIGFVHSNLRTLDMYADRISQYLATVDTSLTQRTSELSGLTSDLSQVKQKLKIDFVLRDLKSLVEQSLDGTSRVQGIVKDLKTFSRVDEADLKSADINEGLRSTLNIVHNELKYKAQIVTDYGELPQLVCYPMQLNQVFLNLLVNAGQAIKEQGEIRIKTYRVNGSINVEISDTGCGIPPEHVARIFEPFFTTKPVGTGTGLGLSMSYSIVKRHQGKIEVHSQPGAGTRFTVVLPIGALGEATS